MQSTPLDYLGPRRVEHSTGRGAPRPSAPPLIGQEGAPGVVAALGDRFDGVGTDGSDSDAALSPSASASFEPNPHQIRPMALRGSSVLKSGGQCAATEEELRRAFDETNELRLQGGGVPSIGGPTAVSVPSDGQLAADARAAAVAAAVEPGPGRLRQDDEAQGNLPSTAGELCASGVGGDAWSLLPPGITASERSDAIEKGLEGAIRRLRASGYNLDLEGLPELATLVAGGDPSCLMPYVRSL